MVPPLVQLKCAIINPKKAEKSCKNLSFEKRVHQNVLPYLQPENGPLLGGSFSYSHCRELPTGPNIKRPRLNVSKFEALLKERILRNHQFSLLALRYFNPLFTINKSNVTDVLNHLQIRLRKYFNLGSLRAGKKHFTRRKMKLHLKAMCQVIYVDRFDS